MSRLVNLGRRLKEFKSEKDFKELYGLCNTHIINYCLLFDNLLEQELEDIYQEVMIEVWNNIGKYDVDNYSISTLVTMKMQQRISDYIKRRKSKEVETVEITEFKVVEKTETINTEEEYIKSESIDEFWENVKNILTDKNFDILFRFYAQKMSVKDLANKHKCNVQIILNRLYQSKQKLKNHVELQSHLNY